jgi:hypothetical protein
MHSAKPNIWLFKSKKINHLLAFAFKPDLVAESQSRLEAYCNPQRHCVKIIHLLESQLSMVMYRCLFSNIQMARQELAFEKRIMHGIVKIYI